MKRNWLVFDCNALAWAAFHTTGGLSYNNTPTGVIYGFLSQVMRITGDLQSNDLVFCFDYGKSHRFNLLPTYKHKRKARRETSEREQAIYAQVHKQITLLRTKYLRSIGFRNVLFQKHYEADDIIAEVVLHSLREDESATIVSGDEDFYQLLGKNIALYKPIPKTLMTRAQFIKSYGVKPRQWVDVKSLAGCSSDDVPGIAGIGETTALKYLRGELKPTLKAYQKIQDGIETGIMERNRPLVKLPFKGVAPIQLRRKKRELNFDPVFQECNIRTLDPDAVYCER